MSQPPDLLALLVQASYDQYSATVRRLTALQQAEIIRLQATVAAIRSTITDAMSGPWMPTSRHVLGLLWPGEQVIAAFTEPPAE